MQRLPILCQSEEEEISDLSLRPPGISTDLLTVLQAGFLLGFLLVLYATAVHAQQARAAEPSNTQSVTNDTVIFLLDRFPAKQVAGIIGSSVSPIHFQLDDAAIASLISHGADASVLQAMFNAMMKSHGELTNPPPAHAPPSPAKPLPIRVPQTIALQDIAESTITSTKLGKRQLGGKILLDVETGDVRPPLITHSGVYDLYFYNINKILFDYRLVNQLVSTAPASGDLAELKDALAAVTSAFQGSTSTTADNSKKANTKTTAETRTEAEIKACVDLSPILSEVTKAVKQVQQDLSGPGFSPEGSNGGCHHVPYVLTKKAWEAAQSHYGRLSDCAVSSTVQCTMHKLSEQFDQNKAKLCAGTDVETAYEAYMELHDRLQNLANRFADVETIILPDSRVAVPYMVQHQFININSSGSLELHEMDCGNSSDNQAGPKPKSDRQQSDHTGGNLGGMQGAATNSSESPGDPQSLGRAETGKSPASNTGDNTDSAAKSDGKITGQMKPPKGPMTSAAVDTDISPRSYTLTSGHDALSASAGLLLTSLQSRSYTFAATPNGSGRILQVDGIGAFRPALSALLNYDIPYLPNYKDIGLAVSAGLVLDLANGKADTSTFGFFVGPSAHLFHRFFISPGWHFGQFADYPVGFGQNPNQVITNNNLGTPVPVKRYTGRFAVSLTFQIPTPSAKPKMDNGTTPATPKPDSNKAKTAGAPQAQRQVDRGDTNP